MLKELDAKRRNKDAQSAMPNGKEGTSSPTPPPAVATTTTDTATTATTDATKATTADVQASAYSAAVSSIVIAHAEAMDCLRLCESVSCPLKLEELSFVVDSCERRVQDVEWTMECLHREEEEEDD